MPTYHLSNEAALDVSCPILHTHFASFDAGVLFTQRIYRSTLENRYQSLNALVIIPTYATRFQCTLLYILHVNFSFVEPEYRGGLYINLEKKMLVSKVKDAYPVLVEFNAVNASFKESAIATALYVVCEHTWFLVASSETDSLNFPRQERASCSFPIASGLKVKVKTAMGEVPISRNNPSGWDCSRALNREVTSGACLLGTGWRR